MAKANVDVGRQSEGRNGIYILIYFFEWISGVIAYFTAGKNDKRIKIHSLQAILLGVIAIILSFIPIIGAVIAFIIWLYGLYVGYKAYTGIDIVIPGITGYVRNKVGYTQTKHEKRQSASKKQDTDEPDNGALEELKLRYAKGELTKAQYNKIKKDL